jgi:hypothetical protein
MLAARAGSFSAQLSGAADFRLWRGWDLFNFCAPPVGNCPTDARRRRAGFVCRSDRCHSVSEAVPGKEIKILSLRLSRAGRICVQVDLADMAPRCQRPAIVFQIFDSWCMHSQALHFAHRVGMISEADHGCTGGLEAFRLVGRDWPKPPDLRRRRLTRHTLQAWSSLSSRRRASPGGVRTRPAPARIASIRPQPPGNVRRLGRRQGSGPQTRDKQKQ